MATIDMQTMRYINLLDRVARVKTMKCFNYNGTIIYAVPRELISKAIGSGASNIRQMQDILGKRIKIIQEAAGIDKAEKFVSDIVEPIKFKSLEVKEQELVISSGSMQNKAALMGRNKKRMEELALIIKDTFNLDLKIL